MIKTVISSIILIGFIIWFGHIIIMLFNDLQDNNKEINVAFKLAVKALITLLFVTILIYL